MMTEHELAVIGIKVSATVSVPMLSKKSRATVQITRFQQTDVDGMPMITIVGYRIYQSTGCMSDRVLVYTARVADVHAR